LCVERRNKGIDRKNIFKNNQLIKNIVAAETCCAVG
jgi:hypothetical protein